MRLCVTPTSPHCHPAVLARIDQVLLDGRPVSHVIEFDQEGGWLHRFKTENGAPVVAREPDRLVTEVLEGSVDYTLREAA